MPLYSAPSDMDYWDWANGQRHDGIQRSCHRCGEPVLVLRDETYLVQVFCVTCIADADTRRREHEDEKTGVA